MEQHGTPRIMPLLMIGALFFIFGFMTWLNATLIPYLKISCEIESDIQAYLVTFAFYISYTLMALPASMVLKRTGFKNGISLGLGIIAAGALVFIPSALTRNFTIFLAGLFIQGTGLALCQTAANPYITIVGPHESAARRISAMGIANKIAGILSPLILGFIVLRGSDELVARLATLGAAERAQELNALAVRIIPPYAVFALLLLAFALIIRWSPLPEADIHDDADSEKPMSTKIGIARFPHLWMGVLAIFLYVGAEVIAVDTQPLYGTWLGFPLADAKYFSSITLTAMVVGYCVGIAAIPRFISQASALALFSVTGVAFSLCAVLIPREFALSLPGVTMAPGFASVLCIALLGFSNSIMWPAIWPLAIRGLGSFTKTGSALLIMGIAGGALLPLVYGSLAGSVGNQLAYGILVPCYAFILFYALKGHRAR